MLSFHSHTTTLKFIMNVYINSLDVIAETVETILKKTKSLIKITFMKSTSVAYFHLHIPYLKRISVFAYKAVGMVLQKY